MKKFKEYCFLHSSNTEILNKAIDYIKAVGYVSGMKVECPRPEYMISARGVYFLTDNTGMKIFKDLLCKDIGIKVVKRIPTIEEKDLDVFLWISCLSDEQDNGQIFRYLRDPEENKVRYYIIPETLSDFKDSMASLIEIYLGHGKVEYRKMTKEQILHDFIYPGTKLEKVILKDIDKWNKRQLKK